MGSRKDRIFSTGKILGAGGIGTSKSWQGFEYSRLKI